MISFFKTAVWAGALWRQPEVSIIDNAINNRMKEDQS